MVPIPRCCGSFLNNLGRYVGNDITYARTQAEHRYAVSTRFCPRNLDPRIARKFLVSFNANLSYTGTPKKACIIVGSPNLLTKNPVLCAHCVSEACLRPLGYSVRNPVNGHAHVFK